MTGEKYVISKEQLLDIGSPNISAMDIAAIQKDVLSHPISAELKKEWNRLIDQFSARFRSTYFFFDDVKFDETIESLRDEP